MRWGLISKEEVRKERERKKIIKAALFWVLWTDWSLYACVCVRACVVKYILKELNRSQSHTKRKKNLREQHNIQAQKTMTLPFMAVALDYAATSTPSS